MVEAEGTEIGGSYAPNHQIAFPSHELSYRATIASYSTVSHLYRRVNSARILLPATRYRYVAVAIGKKDGVTGIPLEHAIEMKTSIQKHVAR